MKQPVFRIVDKNGKHVSSYEGKDVYMIRGSANNICSRWNNESWKTRGPYTVQEGVIEWPES